ncbi:MAG: hypothetical protein M3024_14520, partial [Candidatus Dormibacteraeota bacterium]|nr:hypothetical protein [Candidatus Dormibacteraeota bacterium]
MTDFLDEAAARVRTRALEMHTMVLRRTLAPWAAEQGIVAAAELDQRVMSRWVGHLRQTHRTPRGESLSEASVATYARTANQFLRWLDSPARAQAPALRRRTLEVLSRKEISALEAAATTERDKLLIRTLADTGARLGEVLSLREADILEEKREHVLRLGGKTGQR